MHIHHEYRYCPVCGGDLEVILVKENEPKRPVCNRCGYIFYLDPKLVACAIIQIDLGIVLLKRAMDPEKGKWVVPGGYVDRGEVVEDAAIRETREECGINIKVDRLLGVYSYPGIEDIVIFYTGIYKSGKLIAGDESTKVMTVSPDEIPWGKLAFKSTRDALRDYCRLFKYGI